MSWFGPKLEPAETIVLREWRGRQIFWLVALLFFVFLPVEFGLFLSGESSDGISVGRLLTLVPLAALSLLLAILPLLLLFGDEAWRLTITTRRILHRPGIWGNATEEIPIAGIEDVGTSPDGDGLILRGGGKELVISADGKARARILAALGRT